LTLTNAIINVTRSLPSFLAPLCLKAHNCGQ
jgi:hypothetical protein